MSSITASRGVASITPPSSSHGNRDWDYSVPLDTPADDGDTYYNYANRKNATGSSRSRKGSLAKGRGIPEERKISGSYTRSNSDLAREAQKNPFLNAPTNASLHANGNHDFLTAPRAPALMKPGSNPVEGESGGDMFSAHRLSTMSGATEILPNVNGSATAMYDFTGDIDNREASSWIHRDKLMRIESHEFRKSSPNPNDAWVKTAQRKLSVDRISKARGSTWDNHGDDDGSANVFENDDCDLRLPEEREAELFAQRMAAARSRSLTPSKIPVNVASPAPIPLEFFERNSPLKRPRSDSADGDDIQSISYPATRARSYSTGSQEPPVTPPEKPSTASTAASVTPPSKLSNRANQSKTQASPRRPSSSHRTSSQNAKSISKPRTVSATGNRTSATNTTNAAAAKHSQYSTPEGPPPWALGTYAPDPKLPQDQQIIPTVAKRLQQEQWEREGVSASVYDRELRPLKIHDNEGEPKEAMNFGEQSSLWPLPSEKQRDNPPMIEPSKGQHPESKPQPKEPIRVKDPEAMPGKGKKEKGCCGCTIM